MAFLLFLLTSVEVLLRRVSLSLPSLSPRKPGMTATCASHFEKFFEGHDGAGSLEAHLEKRQKNEARRSFPFIIFVLF